MRGFPRTVGFCTESTGCAAFRAHGHDRSCCVFSMGDFVVEEFIFAVSSTQTKASSLLTSKGSTSTTNTTTATSLSSLLVWLAFGSSSSFFG
jgi:hypothetical protein